MEIVFVILAAICGAISSYLIANGFRQEPKLYVYDDYQMYKQDFENFRWATLLAFLFVIFLGLSLSL